MRLPTWKACVLLLPGLLPAADAADGDAGVQSLLQRYCWDCHGAELQKGGLDLHALAMAELAANGELLSSLSQRLADGEMPPTKAPQPTAAEREALLAWLHAHAPAARPAPPDDPGRVVMPRLTPTQYERVIADLTGVAIPLAASLPHDGGAGEGFDNVGEAQPMTPTYLQAYLAAAKEVLAHARIVPGQPIEWSRGARAAELSSPRAVYDSLAPEWSGWYTSLFTREKERHLAELRAQVGANPGWRDWDTYGGIPQTVWLPAYLEAAWEHRYAAQLGRADWPLERFAAAHEPPLHPRVLEVLVARLEAPSENILWQGISDRWHGLPPPPMDGKAVFARCVEDLLTYARTSPLYCPDTGANWIDRWEPFEDRGEDRQFGSSGATEMVFEKEKHGLRPFRCKVAGRHELWFITGDCADGNDDDVMIWEQGTLTRGGKQEPWTAATIDDGSGNAIAWGSHPDHATGPLPADSVSVHAPAVLHVTFPADTTYFTVQARADPLCKDGSMIAAVLDHPPSAEQRHAVAHHQPYGVPGSARVKKLQAWSATMYGLTAITAGEVPFDECMPPEVRQRWSPPKPAQRPARADATAARPPAIGSFRMIADSEDAYLALATPADLHRREHLADFMRGTIEARDVLVDFLAARRIKATNAAAAMAFEPVGLTGTQVEEYQRLIVAARADEQRLLDCARAHLREFAARAWREEPSTAAIERLLAFYEKARDEGLAYGAALKPALMAALVSPRFLYRLQDGKDSDSPYALQGRDLAQRLAFALWGSLPDDELLKAAAGGRLGDPAELERQIRRMIVDPRSAALATEFAAQAFLFAGFDSFRGPDAQKFPQFTDEVRAAMYGECVAFFKGIFLEDRPLTEVVDADYACVNETLARFYGIPGVTGGEFRRVQVDRAQRGGVLGMGAFLIANSAPLRSSPSKRGHWVLAQVLGTPPPPPPGNVAQLSRDDHDEQGQTVVQQLARHRTDPACMNCHTRIDPLGVALESFDAIGRRRATLDGKSPVVDTDAIEGIEIHGFAGLKAWLDQDRQRRLVMRNLCRKFVGYSLGRGLQPSDDALIGRLMTDLEAQGWRSSALVVGVLTSPQFTHRRDAVAAAAKEKP
jgi:hypothetical protein